MERKNQFLPSFLLFFIDALEKKGRRICYLSEWILDYVWRAVMGRKKFIFISIIILFTVQTSACSVEGQEGQGIWHNEYESETEISSTEEECKDVSENENITFRVLDGKEISVSRDRLMDTGRINNRWKNMKMDTQSVLMAMKARFLSF